MMLKFGHTMYCKQQSHESFNLSRIPLGPNLSQIQHLVKNSLKPNNQTEYFKEVDLNMSLLWSGKEDKGIFGDVPHCKLYFFPQKRLPSIS